MALGYPDSMTQNLKTRMSFTDLIPTVSLAGLSNSVAAMGNFLSPIFNPDQSESDTERLVGLFESVDFLLTMIKNPIISLFVNPQSITVSKNILLNKQVTKGGFVVQFWGPDLETIQVRAETGYFGLSKAPLQAFNLFKDYCFQGRYHPRKPFKSVPIITMMYEGQALKGYFNNLTYTVVQQRPYIITYDFTFTVTELITIPIVSSIAKIFDKFNPNTNSSGSEIQDSVDMGKGWGVKLY